MVNDVSLTELLLIFWWWILNSESTFWAYVGAGNAHLDPVLLHLHLVARTGSDTRAVVHHEVICHATSGERTNC